MPKYLIAFDEGWMTFPEEDLPTVAAESRAVVQDAVDAGVYVFGGGMAVAAETDVVSPDGTVTAGPRPAGRPVVGGFWVVDVPTRAEAVVWAQRTAAACRCTQEVRLIE